MWQKLAVAAAGPMLVVVSIVLVQPAHADYFEYPCSYPFVGSSGDANFFLDVGAQYCDGPTEINWTHYHCWSAGATVHIGVLSYAPIGGNTSLDGLGEGGIGGHGGQCRYVCPDGMIAPFPNPPAAWVKRMVLQARDNDCLGHAGIIGDTSTPLVNQLPGDIAPGDDPPDGAVVPEFPGWLPVGEHNPSTTMAVLGQAGLDAAADLSEPEVEIPMSPEGRSPLTPGSPLELP